MSLHANWGGHFFSEERKPTLKERAHQVVPMEGLCRATFGGGLGRVRCILLSTHGHGGSEGRGHYYPGHGWWFWDSRYQDGLDVEKYRNDKGTP